MRAGCLLRPVFQRAAAVLCCAAFVTVVASFLVPLPVAFAPLFTGKDTGALLRSVFTSPRLWQAFRFTVMQAGVSTLIALALGIPAAVFVARRTFFGRRFLAALSAVPLCVSPLLIALGFVLFYGMQGTLNRILMVLFSLDSPPVTFLYSFWGIVVAHGFYDFPVVMRMTADLWERIPPEEADAARLLGAGEFRVFRTVTLFQLAPAIAASCTLVFLYCFFSFVIVLLFGSIGGTTIEVEIYQAARLSLNFPYASALAIVETVCALGIVSLYAFLEKRSVHSAGLKRTEPRTALRNAKEKSAAAAFLVCILLFFIGPLAAIGWNAFVVRKGYTGFSQISGAAFAALFSRAGFWSALKNTLLTGVCTAVVSAAAGTVFAVAVRLRGGNRSVLMRVLPMAPLAVSSVVLSLGWTPLVPRGNPAVLVLAQSALAWPFAMRQVMSALDRVPRSVTEAASLLSPRPLDAVFRVYVPLSARGICTAAAFSFAISAGDASMPLMLAIPGFETLSLYIYRLAGSYRFAEACGCGIVLALITCLVFFVGDE